MSTDPIKFYNRYTGEIEQEQVLGEKYLRHEKQQKKRQDHTGLC